MIGGKTKTISLLMYQEVIGQLNFGKGSVYGAFLLIPAIVAFIADALNKERPNATFSALQGRRKRRGVKEVFAFLFCLAVSLFALLPILSFVILAFATSYPRDMSITLNNLLVTFERGAGEYLVNSLLIALLAALAGTALAYFAAYLASRMRSVASRIIHLLVLTFMAIPGIVLGLSYVVTFSSSFIYGTLFIMVMVNVAHFMASPYLMIYNSFGKMNENLEAVGQTLGVGRLRMLRDVFIPQNLGTIAEMFSYLFVNCMMTISAVSFLANVDTKPLSLLINQFEAQMQYESAAVVSLLILLVNVAIKGAVGLVKSLLASKTKRKKMVTV
jgi:iron(III) transport system permease protein